MMIRFTANSRHGDWSKGDYGEVVSMLAEEGENQKDLYLALHSKSLKTVWVTREDFEPFNQLSLF